VFAEHLKKTGYTEPTAIQQAVLPLLLRGRDVLVRAPTGTGKTLAYLAPLIQQLGTWEPRVSRSDGCRAIVITPTRELTVQVNFLLLLYRSLVASHVDVLCAGLRNFPTLRLAKQHLFSGARTALHSAAPRIEHRV
jgi:Rad3-related DNA helicase